MNDGGPAFPRPNYVELDQTEYHPNRPGRGSICGDDGMSLRDWFAGQALAGMLACPRDIQGAETRQTRVERAYKYADAMLAERAKGATP